MKHSSIVGGSTAARRIHCPGSYALEKDLPQGQASVYAERGTALHYAMEWWITSGKPAEALIGQEFNGFVITHALYETKIAPAIEAFYEIETKAGGFAHYMAEVEVSMEEYVPGSFGTVDILAAGNDGRLYVIDWKFGDGILVSPVANYQAAFYGAGALYGTHEDPAIQSELEQMRGHLFSDGREECDVVLLIVQPREGRPDEPDWSEWDTTSEWLKQFTVLLHNAYRKMISADPPIKAGDHCKFCGALPECPAHRANVRKIMSADQPPTRESLDGLTMAHWLDIFPQIEQFMKAVREHAIKELENGVRIPGWKMVDKRGTRKWTNEDAALNRLLAMGYANEVVTVTKLATPAQLQKQFAAADNGDDYKSVEEYVELVVSGRTLAPDTDSRPDASDPGKTLREVLQATLNAGDSAFPALPLKPKAKSKKLKAKK